MDWPKLYIMLLTYSDDAKGPRSNYAKDTLLRALNGIHYSGQISVHIADNGSVPEHRKALVEIAGGFSHVRGITVSDTGGHSYGKSYNLGTQAIHNYVGENDLILPLEDDWHLAEDLLIDDYAYDLSREFIRSVRLGYLGFTQQLKGELKHGQNKTYLIFDPYSREPHISAGHPRLETVLHQRTVGPWTEGLDPGSTEMEWCNRWQARQLIAWPMDCPRGGWFQHVGTVQARTDQ